MITTLSERAKTGFYSDTAQKSTIPKQSKPRVIIFTSPLANQGTYTDFAIQNNRNLLLLTSCGYAYKTGKYIITDPMIFIIGTWTTTTNNNIDVFYKTGIFMYIEKDNIMNDLIISK